MDKEKPKHSNSIDLSSKEYALSFILKELSNNYSLKNGLGIWGNAFQIIEINTDDFKYTDYYSTLKKDEVKNLDFLFFDTQKKDSSIFSELCYWFSSVKEEGIIAGNGYLGLDKQEFTNSIDKFFSRFDWKIHHGDNSLWWVEKKRISISFIIPAYNCEKTLAETVDSIFDGNINQGDEIVIVNDASTDNTENVIQVLMRKYPQIIPINHKFNRGGGAARNTAVENSNNQLIFCVDSDNVLASNSVERLKEFLLTTGSEATCFNELRYFIDNTSNLSHSWIYNHSIYTINEYLSEDIVPGASGNYLYTVSSWKKAGGYPEYASALDTWGFGLRQHFSGTQIAVLKNSYYFHRIGIDSYWVRESRKGKLLVHKIQLLLPYIGSFKQSDVKWLLSQLNNKNVDIEFYKHPFRITTKNEEIKGKIKLKQTKFYLFLQKTIKKLISILQVIHR